MMPQEKSKSALVELLMPDASDAKRDDATRRWFGFLMTIDRIAARLEEKNRDSRNPREDD
jgi:hypothetical protein